MSSTLTTHEPKVHQHHSHRTGLRTVGLIEALKGVLALVVAYALIRMLRHDVDFEEAAERILFFFHISPHHHWSQQLLNAADRMSSTSIAMVAGIALAYSSLRFLEGFGLWKQRVWGEWLAIISGCVYIPFELYKLIRHPSQLHWIILGINVMVVLYIAWVRWDEFIAARERQRMLGGG